MSELTFGDRHAAFLAGLEYGLMERARLEAEDQVQTLNALADLAKTTAKHGAAFTQMCREAGERDD